MSDNLGQIIAIGGGGFGRSIYNTKIDKYILKQSSSEKPNVCFIPTASAEDKAYTVNFYAVYSKLNCNPTHINFFQRTPRLDSIINKQDIIFVGGGNTKSMLAVFKEWNISNLLIRANQKGKILAGVSAGMICWYEKGVTDSWSDELKIIDCLNILPGCSCPHYDGEEDRRPSVHKFILENNINSCLAVEDGAAVHYKNNSIYRCISFYNNKNAYQVKYQEDKLIESPLKKIDL